ncbi:hypothetical protein Q8F55_009283 [Vanrija albida]|uniref:DUF924-domain-containing protein n=1 Tax=Vanrija albida TaxID=181172 RepID=A0ABR3PT65_9TREE
MSSNTTPQPEWVDDVLHFWFKQFGPAEWFAGGAHVDSLCREHYLPLWQKLSQASPAQACADSCGQASTALAAIVVYDQFSRNMFRKTPEAFSTDPQALALSKDAVAKGFDKGRTDPEKLFLYMPHMHSESLADQDKVVELIEAMGGAGENKEAVAFAKEHRDIIAQFGRFPHRNEVLGRQSTPEEEAFLKSHAGFGQ